MLQSIIILALCGTSRRFVQILSGCGGGGGDWSSGQSGPVTSPKVEKRWQRTVTQIVVSDDVTRGPVITASQCLVSFKPNAEKPRRLRYYPNLLMQSAVPSGGYGVQIALFNRVYFGPFLIYTY